MSKTNQQVHEAFSKGKAAHNSRYTLESTERVVGQENFTFLTSYRTTIAIRRAEDGAEFRDAHSYSPTTSQHQRGHYGIPAFSFDCVAELMGDRWYETAHIQDWGPRSCDNPECGQERTKHHAQWVAGLMPWYDMFSRCWGLGDPQDRHTVTIPGYGDGYYGASAAVLLSFTIRGQQVLCGFESGKSVRFGGRTDQLWAAILPFRVHDIVQAFEALKPAYVRNAERHNKWRAEQVNPPNTEPHVAIRRQGDLYFVECPNGQGPPKEAFKLDGVTLPPGERANHRASQVRVMCDASSRAPGTGYGPTDGWRIWAKGNIDHPEHARLRLGGWHRVLQSAALRGASSAYTHPMGGGRGVYGD